MEDITRASLVFLSFWGGLAGGGAEISLEIIFDNSSNLYRLVSRYVYAAGKYR